MTVEETAIRRPTYIREEAFFYEELNRARLYSKLPPDFSVIPQPGWYAYFGFIAGGVGLILLSLLFIVGWNFWIVMLLFGLVAMVAVPMIMQHQRTRLLATRFGKEGYIVVGEVVSAIASMEGSPLIQSSYKFIVEIEYRFAAPQGEIFRSSIKAARPDLNGKQLPLPGTPVYVLYFSEAEAYLL